MLPSARIQFLFRATDLPGKEQCDRRSELELHVLRRVAACVHVHQLAVFLLCLYKPICLLEIKRKRKHVFILYN